MTTAPDTVTGSAVRSRLRVSPRECRLVVDRLLLLQGLSLGAVPPTRDCLLESQRAGFDALGELAAGLDVGATTRPGRVVVEDADRSTTSVDCLGQHALLVAPALLDLVRTVGASGGHEIRVRRVRCGHFLGGLAAALRTGEPTVRMVGGSRATSGDTASHVLAIEPAVASGPDGADGPVAGAYNAMSDGLDVDEDLWWRLYRKSNLVLSPDDPVSRRHAGATLVDEAGRVFGDTDEVIDKDLYQGRTSPGFDETRR